MNKMEKENSVLKKMQKSLQSNDKVKIQSSLQELEMQTCNMQTCENSFDILLSNLINSVYEYKQTLALTTRHIKKEQFDLAQKKIEIANSKINQIVQNAKEITNQTNKEE